MRQTMRWLHVFVKLLSVAALLLDGNSALQKNEIEWFNNVTQIHNLTCSYRPEATDSFNVTKGVDSGRCCGFCQDSVDCSKYGSCCPGKYRSFETGRTALMQTRFACIRPSVMVLTEARPRIDIPDVWMITSCSNNTKYTEAYIERCTTTRTDDYLNSITPVSVSNITFKNKYCAFCSDVKDDQEMKMWNIEIRCNSSVSPSDDNLYSKMKERNCSLSFLPPDDISLQICFLPEYHISTCNVTGHWPNYDEITERACQSFVDPFNFTYQNYFCYLCNIDRPGAREEWHCPGEGMHINMITPPFIAIINPDAVQRWEKDEDLDCNMLNQFQDRKKSLCRDIRCRNNFRFLGQQCSPEGLNMCLLVNVYIKLVPELETPLFDSALEGDFLLDIIASFYSRFSTFDSMEGLKVYKKSIISDGMYVIQHLVIHLGVVTDLFHWYDDILKISAFFHYKDTIYATNRGTEISFSPEFTFCEKVIGNSAIILCKPEHETSSSDELVLHYKLNNFDDNSYCNQTIFNQLLICPFITAGVNEFSIKIKDRFATFEDTIPKIHLAEWQYEISDDTIKICLNDFQSIYDSLPWSNLTDSIAITEKIYASRIVSFICVCISIVCLTVTIFTYALRPELRTQPGINNIILCISLLLAQTFYQFGAGQRSLSYLSCSFIGIICHFLWLCVIFSMSACSFLMFTVFKEYSRVSRQFNWTTTVRSILYIVFSSFVFVVINILVSFLTSGGKKSGYGAYICYISDSLMHLFTFIIPTVVTIIVNIVMFSYVVFVINKARNAEALLNQERNYFAIYARLSTLTGLTWIFGYIHIFIELEIFEYLFIIFNASQGVFIMLAFVIKSRNCPIYCKILRKGKSETSNTSVS